MEVKLISELYSRVTNPVSTVYVVPLIRYDFKKTDYLYLFYKGLIEGSSDIKLKDLSVFAHIRMVFGALLNQNTILHYHWLEFQDMKSLLGMPYKLLCIALYKLLGGHIVWTIHNLTPHDKRFLSLHRSIHQWMAKKASVLHVHSGSVVERVSDFLDVDESKCIVLAHPEFPSVTVSKKEAIERFSKNYSIGTERFKTPTFLIFGGLSAYKGIEEIAKILNGETSPFALLIAGPFKKGQGVLEDKLTKMAETDERIILIPAFIPEEDYPLLFSASDICVFNYDDILTSGGIEMALAYKKQIIAPYKGSLSDYEGLSNVSLFNSPGELKELISHFLKVGADG
ncbi:MAG: hypothetical protein RLN81_16785 [Balneolaceae bacterium]